MTSTTLAMCLSFLLLTLVCGVSSTELFVGIKNANNTEGCGFSATFPCQSLNYLVDQVSEPFDSITILEGRYTINYTTIIDVPGLTITGNGFASFFPLLSLNSNSISDSVALHRLCYVSIRKRRRFDHDQSGFLPVFHLLHQL